MNQQKENRIKKSFVAGSLASSAGIFIAKAIGLLYVIPFTNLAGDANKAFYTQAYTHYNVLLQICSAGLPYAVAAIIAKYTEKEDYKTVMLVRQLSTGILAVSGFIMALIFVLMAKPLAISSLGAKATPEDIIFLRNTFVIMALAVFLVPILYSYRGFYQGLKELKLYANSQVIEQLVRVSSLLLLGWLAVDVFNLERIWAVYAAVFAASIGAIVTILYYRAYDRRHIGVYKRAARAQSTPAVSKKEILKELFAFGVPYVIAAVFGNSQMLINNQYFIGLNTKLGMDYELAKTLLGIMQMNCDKLTSIPQVLGMGFSAGIVPYMTVSLEAHDYRELRKNIEQCLDTVLYIAVPVCFAMAVLSRPIYYVMFGHLNLDYGEYLLRYSSVLGLVTTLTPICNSMMMTLHLRKESIIYLGVGFAVKCITFYPLIVKTGYSGAITSSILCSCSIIYLCLAKISNRFKVRYDKTFRRFIKIILACLAMNGSFVLLRVVGLDFVETSRMIALLQLLVYTVVGMFVYFEVTTMMKLPQAIFHMTIKDMIRLVLGKRNRKGYQNA